MRLIYFLALSLCLHLAIILTPSPFNFSTAPKFNLQKQIEVSLFEETTTSKAPNRGSIKKISNPVGKKKSRSIASDALLAKSKGSLRPAYPKLSVEYGEEGEVDLEVFIDRHGRVKSVIIKHSSGFHRLDQAAIKSVKNSLFNPAKEKEKPVASSKELKFKFILKDI